MIEETKRRIKYLLRNEGYEISKFGDIHEYTFEQV